MSIALESISSRGMRQIEPSGYACLTTPLIFESPPERRVVDVEAEAEDEEEVNECSSSAASSTTSSIGKNRDLSERESSDGENCEEENEVQSAFKGTLSSMDALEEALPMRRGISKFYNGKSKSFTSLAEASSSCSIKDIAKPENAYTRKRSNLLAFNYVWDKNNRSFPHRSNGGGISKRPISSSKSTLPLAVAMSSSESISSTSEDSTSSSNSKSPPHLPPLHPRSSRTSHSTLDSMSSPRQSLSPWRSFSVADLQHCAASTATSFDKTDH